MPVWVVASSASVLAVANGAAEVYGLRGRLLYKVFSRLGPSWWSIQALRILGFVITVGWWVRTLAIKRSGANVSDIFVGFGGGPESQMYREFEVESDRQVVYVDQTNPASLAIVARPHLGSLISNVWSQAAIVVQTLRRSPAAAVNRNLDLWLTSAAIRFCAYVYARAWAGALGPSVSRIVFTSPDIPAFAALEILKRSGGPTVEFRQHGLLQHSISIPGFDKIVALNVPEAEHLQSRSPSSVVTVRLLPRSESRAPRGRTILFASVNSFAEFDKTNHISVIREVVAWTFEQGFKLVVRPHPRESDGFWESNFPVIELDKSSGRFQDCLVRWNPMFVISWFSTTLVDALGGNVLPIFIRQGSEYILPDLVFPLEKLAFAWPSDRYALDKLAGSPEAYQQVLDERRRFAFGECGLSADADNANSRS